MAPLLSFRDVSKTFWRGAHELVVLREVSFDLHAGDFVAVYGQRRAGKTTLLKLAAGFETPDSGTVCFEEEDIAGLHPTALAHLHRRRIGWVERAGPKSNELAIADYVALPLLKAHRHGDAQRLAIAALARVGVKECASGRWEDLSDAERALVSIAHALVREPRLLLLDDPTAGLDVIERERIVALLRSAADKARVGVLMAVPDMPSMMRAHDVLSLSGGQLLAPPELPPDGQGRVIDFPGAESSA